MVDVFNQITHQELSDYLFEEILQNHFLKFRHFYYNTVDIDDKITEKVTSISCSASDDGIYITLLFSKEKDLKSYLKSMQDIYDVSEYIEDKEYFVVTINSSEDNELNISIENSSVQGEEFIYEDRSDSN